MVLVNRNSLPPGGLRCRQIDETDIEAVASFLARGFPAHERGFWLDAFARLTKHEPPPGFPKYGYLLESDRVVVGAILLICSTLPADGAVTTRCNLSSWYVEPRFRPYAPMLVSQAVRDKDVTYINISPAPHTRPIIEAQGFSRYCEGIFFAVPLLRGLFDGAGVKILEAHVQPDVAFDPLEWELLLQHLAYGCISFWCATSDRAYGFVFRPNWVKFFIPSAHLIYCADSADFLRFAGPIGRFLARRGRMLVAVDANGPIAGLTGTFRQGNMPKYFKGPKRPRLGDIAYTEYAMLGV
jgi:hypothetical protein